MDAAMAYELCGVSEKKIMRRKATEAKRKKDDRLNKLYQHILAKIKNSTDQQGWEKVSFEEIAKSDELDSRATDRGPIMYRLQADPNIISRPVTTGNSKDGTIPHTIPLEYKFVSKQEKIEMAADAVCFRQVQGVNKKRIISALSKMSHPIENEWAEIFAVAEYLITRGALKDWIYLRPLDVASMSNVDIEHVICALIALYEVKILVIKSLDHPLDGEVARTKRICRLVKNENDFEVFSEMPIDDIHHVGVEKKQRAGKRKDLNKEKLFLAEIRQEQIATDDREDHPIQAFFKRILEQGIPGLQKIVDEEISKKVSDKNALLSKQSTEIADLRDENARLKRELEKSKIIQSKLVEFNDGVIAAAQDEMYVLQGAISDIVKDYAQYAEKDRTMLTDRSQVNKLAGRIINAIGRITDSMIKYKNDKFPPAEKR